ncbi:hypothetical protein ACWEXP_03980 [Staphylococcus pseudoxylosus]
MVKYKVLKDAIDKKTDKDYATGDIIDEPVRVITYFEKRLKDKGYELPFFERVHKPKKK